MKQNCRNYWSNWRDWPAHQLCFYRKALRWFGGKNQNELKKAEKTYPLKTQDFQADVTSEAEMRDTISYTEDQFGSLDIAFLNAGVEGPVKSILIILQMNSILAINVRGFYGLKFALL